MIRFFFNGATNSLVKRKIREEGSKGYKSKSESAVSHRPMETALSPHSHHHREKPACYGFIHTFTLEHFPMAELYSDRTPPPPPLPLYFFPCIFFTRRQKREWEREWGEENMKEGWTRVTEGLVLKPSASICMEKHSSTDFLYGMNLPKQKNAELNISTVPKKYVSTKTLKNNVYQSYSTSVEWIILSLSLSVWN